MDDLTKDLIETEEKLFKLIVKHNLKDEAHLLMRAWFEFFTYMRTVWL
ncbi:MAG: hypothetical protein GY804_02545 [Alphaproteobacteria bacterium]|nr:hypothetical protein [Alphaproteobacteria bacterium]